LFKASDFYKINNGECAACFVRKWESIGQVWPEQTGNPLWR